LHLKILLKMPYKGVWEVMFVERIFSEMGLFW